MGINTLGTVPGVAALGYDSMGFHTQGLWPSGPVYMVSSSAYGGTWGTASTDTTGAQTISTFQSATTATVYAQPFILPFNLSYHEVRNLHSFATAAGTGSVTAGFVMGLYSRSTTGNATTTDTVYSRVALFQKNYRLTQNSQTELSVFSYNGSESSQSSGSTTSGTNANWNGIRVVPYHTATTGVTQVLESGNYLLLHAVTSKTSGGANVISQFASVQNYSSGSNEGNWGNPVNAPVSSGSALNHGYFSTTVSFGTTATLNATYAGHPILPTTLASSVITGTVSNNRFLIPQFQTTNT